MAIDLPVMQAHPLRVEDLEGLKDLIIQKAAPSITISQAAMKKKIKLQTATAIPVYQLTLTALAETRDPDLKEVLAPCPEAYNNGHQLLTKEQIELWSHPSRPPDSFSASEGTFAIEPSLHKTDCPTCGRSGKIICNLCMGSAEIGCPKCKGEGKSFCHFCHGMGHTTCLKCDGRRILRASRTGNPNDVEKCDACRGMGHIACTHCEQGHNPCTTCKSKGIATCTQCKGSSKMTCPTCKGQLNALVGYAFHASFKPVKSVSNAGVDTVPQSVMIAAFSKAVPAGTFDLPTEGKIESHIDEGSMPPAIKNALVRLSGDITATLSENTRIIRQQITLAKGIALKLTGQYDGQDFVYFVQEDTKTVHVEKDPFQNLVGSFGGAAQKAVTSGDWASAILLARKALSYNAGDAGALRVLAQWKRKVFFEAFLMSLGAGAASCLLAGIAIAFEKGLHKTGPFATSAGAIMGMSLLLGSAGAFLLRLLPHHKRRLALGFGVSAAALNIFYFTAKKTGVLPSVQEADQAALNAEMQKSFAYGVGQVYWEKDYQKLVGLLEKYKNTKADLGPIAQAMKKQGDLKAQHANMTQDMNRRTQNILNADAPLERKIADLKIIRDYFSLRSQDVAFVQKNIDTLQKKLSVRKNTPVIRDSHMSIQTLRQTRRLKPLPRVSGRR